ncbi:sodium-dependent glucose transporter 1B-like [Mytilus californianus]|uniref:sodium-dependent glucose transporter 1B-like n=1 Tax=Mytilus californianus TaxID=6549 RepID=UPI002245439B|nr:sodium-dependent glucose transporter 1B-like [Mytilus californianus]XP_052076820.1 sodium-dependent glucose transporter 1B-like [Mytilus californianus]
MESKQNDDKKQPEWETYTTTQKVTKTAVLVFTWLTIGLFNEITGPTQKDLIIKTNSDYELVSRAISGQSVGYFIGAIIGGPLIDKYEKWCYVTIAICLDCAAVAIFAAPYATNTNTLWALLAVAASFEGVVNIVGQRVLIQLWDEKATGPLHLLHFGFGMGSVLAPQIANPFLAVLAPSSKNVTSTVMPNESFVQQVLVIPMQNTSHFHLTNSTNKNTRVEYLKESKIETAYFIVAIIIASVSIVYYIYQFCSRHIILTPGIQVDAKESNFRKVVRLIDPATCTDGNRWFGIQIFILLFLCFFNIGGGDALYGKFIRSYSIDKHNFSGDDASLINTVYWISFAVGRFIGIFTVRFIPIRILLPLEVSGALFTGILLEIFADENDLALWILTIMMGLCVGPIFPSGLGWANAHLEVTGVAITFIVMGMALGAMSYLWVIGYLYQHHGYDMFFHQMIFYGAIVLFFTILMTIIGKIQGGRFEKNEKVIESKPEKSESKVNVTKCYKFDTKL